jgi:hypothetical protein
MFSNAVPFYLVNDTCKVLISEQLCQTLDKQLENLISGIQNLYQFELCGPCNQRFVSYEENYETVTESELVLICSAIVNANL